jgi:hypothetical protein
VVEAEISASVLREGVAKWKRRAWSYKVNPVQARDAARKGAAAAASSQARETSGKHHFGRSWDDVDSDRESKGDRQARHVAHNKKRGIKKSGKKPGYKMVFGSWIKEDETPSASVLSESKGMVKGFKPCYATYEDDRALALKQIRAWEPKKLERSLLKDIQYYADADKTVAAGNKKGQKYSTVAIRRTAVGNVHETMRTARLSKIGKMGVFLEKWLEGYDWHHPAHSFFSDVSNSGIAGYLNSGNVKQARKAVHELTAKWPATEKAILSVQFKVHEDEEISASLLSEGSRGEKRLGRVRKALTKGFTHTDGGPIDPKQGGWSKRKDHRGDMSYSGPVDRSWGANKGDEYVGPESEQGKKIRDAATKWKHKDKQTGARSKGSSYLDDKEKRIDKAKAGDEEARADLKGRAKRTRLDRKRADRDATRSGASMRTKPGDGYARVAVDKGTKKMMWGKPYVYNGKQWLPESVQVSAAILRESA